MSKEHIFPEMALLNYPLITNTGRAFIYKQESENGEFIVPYSTQGSP